MEIACFNLDCRLCVRLSGFLDSVRRPHGAVLRALNLEPSEYAFGHGREFSLPEGGLLISSYHCSRYNTQTRRLTRAMFREVFAQVRLRVPYGYR